MSADENDSSGEDKKSPKRVVVTHYGKKSKQEEDIPSEIAPKAPTHILSSPVDVATGAKAVGKEIPKQENLKQAPKQAELPPLPKPPILDDESEYVLETEDEPESLNEYQTKTSTHSPDAASKSVPPAPEEKSEKKSSGIGAVFFSLLGTAAVFILVFHAYYTQQEIVTLQRQSIDDQKSVSALLAEAKKSFSQLENLRLHHVEQQKSLQDLKAQLDHAQAHLVSLSGDKNWVLSEANYLVFMANERLQAANDIQTAITQLESADDRLKVLGNPAYMWVREVLEKDIAKLKSAPIVKRHELWEQIGNISQEFNQLNFQTLNAAAAQPEDKTAENNQSAWRKALWQSWQELKSIIRVSKVEDYKIPQILSLQEKEQVLQTMQLMCRQIQWAVLQGDNKVYESTLQSLKKLIQQFFTIDSAQQNLLAQIQQLENQNVQIPTPDISSSIKALSQAMIEVSNRKQGDKQ